MPSELKPCRVCGSESVSIFSVDDDTGSNRHDAICDVCGHRIYFAGDSKEEAILNWNLDSEEEDKPMVCSVCHMELQPGDEYLRIGDNFLEVKYFDSEEENLFCSEECLCRSLHVIRDEVPQKAKGGMK